MIRTVRKKIIIAVLAIGALFALAWKAAEIPPPPVAMVVTDANAIMIPVAGVVRTDLRDTFGAARTGHRQTGARSGRSAWPPQDPL